ncbi:protein FAM83C [Pholidichthys leucotaenia]
MTHSQEQSVDENFVYLPVHESSPEFFYCEKEREAVEKLLNAGPEAFYSSIGTEPSGCFLSSEEVSQINNWSENYHFNQLEVQEESGAGFSSEIEDFSTTYFPSYSDTPTPNLELGWPEKIPLVLQVSATVHTSPPVEGEPHVREIIRWHLQNASQVIAIVTDKLTDAAIVGDLHRAASRGVPVYIILNRRSIQENFSLNRLRHPNMRVRVLGGKSFCSKSGRMVIGEMKDKFILVDLETVIHGSYSLTWTDAHLHRQLITVLTGPVIDSFDREFRILFAASLPALATWRSTDAHVNVPQQLKGLDLQFQKWIPQEPQILSPLSPSADSVLDWEAMGVIQRDCSMPGSPLDHHKEVMVQETPLQNNMVFDNSTPIFEGINAQNQTGKEKRVQEDTSPVVTGLPDKSATFKMEERVEKTTSRQVSMDKSPNLFSSPATIHEHEATEPPHIFPSTLRREQSTRQSISEEEESRGDAAISEMENTPSSKKPIILRVPQSENFSSLSDIIKRLRKTSSGLLKKGSNTTMTRSMIDLSVQGTDAHPEERGPCLPRFNSTLNLDYMTRGINLMKKRNDEVKSSLLGISKKTFLPRERPRSSTFDLHLDFRKPIKEMKEE